MLRYPLRENCSLKTFSSALEINVRIMLNTNQYPINYAKLVSFEFGSFCARCNVSHVREVTGTNQLITSKPLIYDWDKILHCVIRNPLHEIRFAFCIIQVFCILLPSELLRLFYPRAVPFETTWNTIRYENIQIIAYWFLGWQYFVKYYYLFTSYF